MSDDAGAPSSFGPRTSPHSVTLHLRHRTVIETFERDYSLPQTVDLGPVVPMIWTAAVLTALLGLTVHLVLLLLSGILVLAALTSMAAVHERSEAISYTTRQVTTEGTARLELTQMQLRIDDQGTDWADIADFYVDDQDVVIAFRDGEDRRIHANQHSSEDLTWLDEAVDSFIEEHSLEDAAEIRLRRQERELRNKVKG